jgi:hypothetical protein
MKTLKFSFWPILLCTTFLCSLLHAQNVHYTAHEWGTFTGLCGSDGQALNGLYVEEEALPVFVHNIGGSFPKLAYDFGKGTPANVELAHVTIKMETPVIYFYSNTAFNADVKVQFTHGLIGQWYPEDSAGVNASYYNNFGPSLDFGNKQSPVSNFIEWKANILPAGADATKVNKQGETNTWTAPRATDANLVQTGGEYEKFLFYRGIGNFDMPVNVSFDNRGNLVIKNNYPENIPYFIVYDKEDNGDVKVWFSGAISSGTSQTVPPVSHVLSIYEINFKMEEFHTALTAAGLYSKESSAMLNTWKTSYFGKSGLRVFWIVPRKFMDGILPLDMNPAPDKLERVLIGRSEILTPAMEKRLYNFYQADHSLAQFAGDRFIEAYKDRMAYLDTHPDAVQAINDKIAASKIDPSIKTRETISLFPNPARNSLSLTIENNEGGNITIVLSDLTGRVVLNRTQNTTGDFFREDLDVSTLSNGMYIVTVQTGSEKFVSRLVKE